MSSRDQTGQGVSGESESIADKYFVCTVCSVLDTTSVLPSPSPSASCCGVLEPRIGRKITDSYWWARLSVTGNGRAWQLELGNGKGDPRGDPRGNPIILSGFYLFRQLRCGKQQFDVLRS